MIDFGRDEPPREGVRGGLEQFRWDSVKGQSLRDRECYLGQSVRIGMQGKFGRFQTYDWWHKRNELESDAFAAEERAEQQSLRQLEKQMQEEALGLKPKRALLNPATELQRLREDPPKQHHRKKRRRREKDEILDEKRDIESDPDNSVDTRNHIDVSRKRPAPGSTHANRSRWDRGAEVSKVSSEPSQLGRPRREAKAIDLNYSKGESSQRHKGRSGTKCAKKY